MKYEPHQGNGNAQGIAIPNSLRFVYSRAVSLATDPTFTCALQTAGGGNRGCLLN